MCDSVVVAAIVAGDVSGIAEAYDRYATSLYAYCHSLLGEPADAAGAADAAAAVRDTFIIAASTIGALRDPGRLRAWLYAVARNECLRRIRARTAAPAPEETPAREEPAHVTGLTANAGAATEPLDPRDLFRSAIPGLSTGEREALLLRLGLGADSAGIASVLGLSRNHAHALLSRAHDQLQIVLGVLLVARAGRRDCPALGELLAGWDGRLTPLLRTRISRHIQRCEACTVRRYREQRRGVRPAIAPAGAPPPAAGLPSGFRDEVLRLATGDAPATVAHRAAVGQRAGPFGHHGFPKPLDPPKPGWRSRRARTVAAGVTTAAAVLAAAALTGGTHRAGPPPAGAAPRITGYVEGAGPGGSRAPGKHGRSARPGDPANIAGTASPSPAAGVPPTASPAASPTASPSGPGASPSSPPPPTPGPPARHGTLSVSPTNIALAPQSSTLTVTARNGPVNWTISEPSGLLGELVVSPASGSLASGRSTKVTITGNGVASLDTQLTANPGNVTITVLIGLGLAAGRG
ncbi:MAG: sigma-70 family RNA polymerase sigma factor [Streptosporangiaceae bacterium]|nr:sigma-70 family RNA polymerase sigma factor [Streptosporangiaceae bacterium]MBV9855176.1 sigma-70 family RNA polymerase sigma factor [Streptosporangiaceae bacterium]